MTDQPIGDVIPQFYCSHGVATYMYVCGKCVREKQEAERHRMMTEAFTRLASVLEKLEAKL